MKAKHPSPHRYPLVETLEPRLPTGDLLFGGLALVGLDALSETSALQPYPPARQSFPALHGRPEPGNEGQSETSPGMVELDIIAPVVLMRGAPAQSQFHTSDMGPPIGGVRDMTGMAQIPLPPEHVEDLPSLGALLPKNRSDLRSPPADVRRGPFVSVQVNVDEDGMNIIGDAANEPSIAINHGMSKDSARAAPLQRVQQVVIGWRQFDTIASNFRQAGYNHSADGGRSWNTASVHQPGVFRSDPVLASSRDGHIYYMSLRTSPSYANDIFITADGGETWSSPQFAYGGDKAWFTVDNTGGMGDGHIYQSWNVAGNDYYPNIFSRSVNGGPTWSFPTSIPDQPVFGTLDVGSDGALYVVGTPGQELDRMVVSKSTNAQNPSLSPTFTSVEVNMGGIMRIGAGPNPGGLLGQAWIAVDRSGGPNHDNVYVLSSINPPGNDPLEVHFIRSTNGGLTWSAPLRVNDDPAGNNAWQWFGTMSVAPNGRIDAVWNDTRHSLADNSINEVYYAYSGDGGVSFSKNIQLTPAWDSHLGWPNQNKIGDYYHMVSENHSAALAYSATFNGEQDVYFLRIGDCNNNFVHDGTDILNSHSQDADQDLIPDECE